MEPPVTLSYREFVALDVQLGHRLSRDGVYLLSRDASPYTPYLYRYNDDDILEVLDARHGARARDVLESVDLPAATLDTLHILQKLRLRSVRLALADAAALEHLTKHKPADFRWDTVWVTGPHYGPGLSHARVEDFLRLYPGWSSVWAMLDLKTSVFAAVPYAVVAWFVLMALVILRADVRMGHA